MTSNQALVLITAILGAVALIITGNGVWVLGVLFLLFLFGPL